MKKRKCLALFLCALFLLNAAPGNLLAETAEKETEAAEPLLLPTETQIPQKPDPTPFNDPTCSSENEVTPAPDPEIIPDQTEETSFTSPPLPEPTAEALQEGALPPEPTPEIPSQDEPLPQPTEAISLTPQPIPEPLERTLKEEEVPLLTTGKPSKALPQGRSGAGARTLAASTLSMYPTIDKETVNLVDGDPDDRITISVETSGGTGPLYYAFDIYQNGVLISYMYAYTSHSSLQFTPTQAGGYIVRVFVYEEATGTELISDAWFSASTLRILSIDHSPRDPVVNDQVMWSIRTEGGTGRLEYKFDLVKEMPSGHWNLIEENEFEKNDWHTFRLSAIGSYFVYAYVLEPEISWYGFGERSEILYVTNPAAKVEIKGVNLSPGSSQRVYQPLTWEVSTTGGFGSLSYSYQVFYNGSKITLDNGSLDNSPNNTFTYVPLRSGRYKLDVFVRDLGTDEVFTASSSNSGVSNLSIDSVTAGKSAAYIGDTVTWTVQSAGGSGWVFGDIVVYLNNEEYAQTSSYEVPLCASFRLDQAGTYHASARVYDEFRTVNDISDSLVVTKRPGAPITKTEAVSATSVRITWKAVAGATGYELWRSTNKTSGYQSVYTGTALSRVDTGVSSGVVYYYKVSSYKINGGDQFDGDFGQPAAAVALSKPATPSAVSLSKRSARVTWATVKGASGYELWRATSPGGTYTRVYRGTAKAYTNAGLTSGKTYYYKVRAYKLNASVSFYGPHSAYRAVKAK